MLTAHSMRNAIESLMHFSTWLPEDLIWAIRRKAAALHKKDYKMATEVIKSYLQSQGWSHLGLFDNQEGQEDIDDTNSDPADLPCCDSLFPSLSAKASAVMRPLMT